MRLLIRMSRCTHGVHLSKLKPPQPGMLWLEHCRSLSPALRRKRQPTGCSAPPTPAFRLSSRGPFMSVLPSYNPPRGLSLLCCSHTCNPAHRARTLSHTPVAFASSSAARSVKTQTDTDRDRTPTTAPPEDVKRILQLAHPERWRLAGKLVYQTKNPLSPYHFKHNFQLE